jgi:hypothetical protein
MSEKETEIKNIVQITSEADFVDKLSSIKNTDNGVNFDLLLDDTKQTIDSLNTEISDFLKSNVDFNNYSVEEKDQMFNDVINKFDNFKNYIKNTKCNFDSTGIEIKTIDKRLHQSVEYTTETLFYGLHLKKNFLNDLPKVNNDFDTYNLSITFSNAIAMYHVLSTLTVKGLNKESYALAHVLYSLTEISKIYQYYDNLTERTNKLIMQWNLGLTQTDAKKLETAVTEQMLLEEIEKAK